MTIDNNNNNNKFQVSTTMSHWENSGNNLRSQEETKMIGLCLWWITIRLGTHSDGGDDDRLIMMKMMVKKNGGDV